MYDPGELAKRTAIRHLVQARDIDGDLADVERRVPKQRKVAEARPRHLPMPQSTTPATRGPAPYPLHLTPTPSSLHPHCLTKDRLRKWVPAPNPSQTADQSGPSEAERERIKDLMVHAWEEDMRVSYGAGLLMWHCFCDEKGVPEESRAPATQALLSAFVAHMAAAYSGKTIAGYLNGVRTWHILHGLQCALEKKEMDTMLHAADKLTPSSSKRKKRQPYTPEFIATVRAHLDLEKPLDAAVYACLTMCFYASARLGEFTMQTLGSFSRSMHVTPLNLSYDQDHNGLQVTVLHLPRTKAAGNEGEDVYWATQEGDTDPTAALAQHLRINQPPDASHLFAYKAANTHRTLTKSKFLERVGDAARAAGLEPLQGHGIRIGSTLEYLLRGVPFDIMKAKGRWAGDSFQLYLRKHAIVIAPYIQATPMHKGFMRYTMPPVR